MFIFRWKKVNPIINNAFVFIFSFAICMVLVLISEKGGKTYLTPVVPLIGTTVYAIAF